MPMVVGETLDLGVETKCSGLDQHFRGEARERNLRLTAQLLGNMCNRLESDAVKHFLGIVCQDSHVGLRCVTVVAVCWRRDPNVVYGETGVLMQAWTLSCLNHNELDETLNLLLKQACRIVQTNIFPLSRSRTFPPRTPETRFFYAQMPLSPFIIPNTHGEFLGYGTACY